MYLQGFNDYFLGAKYGSNSNPEWINGWTKAERISHCGWFDRYGKPNASINKVKQ